MGHRAIHPNLCLASRNTYSRSTSGDLEKITEQLEWWAPPTFFLLVDWRLVRPNAFPSVLQAASPWTLFHKVCHSEPHRCRTKMVDQ